MSAAARVRNSGEAAAVPTITRAAPAFQSRRDHLERAVTAAYLKRNVARGLGNPAHQLQRRLPREGAVEVDHVQEARSLLDEAARRGDGIAALDRHALAPAFRQANAASFEHVDCGIDDETHVNMLTCHSK